MLLVSRVAKSVQFSSGQHFQGLQTFPKCCKVGLSKLKMKMRMKLDHYFFQQEGMTSGVDHYLLYLCYVGLLDTLCSVRTWNLPYWLPILQTFLTGDTRIPVAFLQSCSYVLVWCLFVILRVQLKVDFKQIVFLVPHCINRVLMIRSSTWVRVFLN